MSARNSPSFVSPKISNLRSRRVEFRRHAPKDDSAQLMQRPEFLRLTNMLFRVRNGGLTLRDVRNEGTSGDVHENKGDDDKMSSEKHGFYTKMPQLINT